MTGLNDKVEVGRHPMSEACVCCGRVPKLCQLIIVMLERATRNTRSRILYPNFNELHTSFQATYADLLA